MKANPGHENRPHTKPEAHTNNHRPENKDNLDSRGNLELTNAPTGHNEKEIKNGTKDEHTETRGQRRTQ